MTRLQHISIHLCICSLGKTNIRLSEKEIIRIVEYKIPAVLATGDATLVLKDGDMVMVDGTNGEVKKIKGGN